MEWEVDNMNIKIKEYSKHFDKFRGLMFKKGFDYGIRLRSNGIHTFFMRKPINVILTDKDKKIVKIYYNLKPWRVIWPKKYVYYTYELPVSYKFNFKKNEKLPF